MQASSRGVLDFSNLDLRQPKTWNKIKWVTDDLVTQHLAKLTELQILKQHAVLDYASERSTLEHHWRVTDDLFREFRSCVLPWVAEEAKTSAEVEAELAEQYREAFGDPESPEFQEEMQKLIDEWQASTEKNKE